MDSNKNLLVVDWSSNPDLGEIFAGKKIGDTCEITVKLRIKEIDAKGATAGIEKVSSDYHKEEKEAEPTPEEPMAMEIRPRSKHDLEMEESY